MAAPILPSSLAALSYRQIGCDAELPAVMALIERDLSEPYSIYTYRYFTLNYPELCILCLSRRDSEEELVGVVIGRIDRHHKSGLLRGYIGMLCVKMEWRRAGLGRQLVQRLLSVMTARRWTVREYEQRDDASPPEDGEWLVEVVLEAEHSNGAALRLYEGLGFVRDKWLPNYYLSGTHAFRLKLFVDRGDDDAAANKH